VFVKVMLVKLKKTPRRNQQKQARQDVTYH